VSHLPYLSYYSVFVSSALLQLPSFYSVSKLPIKATISRFGFAMSSPKCFSPPDVAAPHKSYSHICSTTLVSGSKLLTFAGQIGVDVDSANREPAPTFRGQVELALANVTKCLAAAGATTRDIVSVRQYVVNLLPMDPCRRELYEEWLGDHRPPSTLVGVAALAGENLLYEIEVMAIVHG
jgi:enamine deaminase RidA (YjgF/YER057c/UK114 family)